MKSHQSRRGSEGHELVSKPLHLVKAVGEHGVHLHPGLIEQVGKGDLLDNVELQDVKTDFVLPTSLTSCSGKCNKTFLYTLSWHLTLTL